MVTKPYMMVKNARWFTPKSWGLLLKLTEEGWKKTACEFVTVESCPFVGFMLSILGYRPAVKAALMRAVFSEWISTSGGKNTNLVRPRLNRALD